MLIVGSIIMVRGSCSYIYPCTEPKMFYDRGLLSTSAEAQIITATASSTGGTQVLSFSISASKVHSVTSSVSGQPSPTPPTPTRVSRVSPAPLQRRATRVKIFPRRRSVSSFASFCSTSSPSSSSLSSFPPTTRTFSQARAMPLSPPW